MERIFNMIPASSGAFLTMWIIGVVVGVVLIGVIGLFIAIGYQAGHARFTINDQGLRLSPGLYSRFIPKEEINAAGAKVINLNIETGYRPKWRTNGAGLPGYDVGWFKLANKEKALVFVTDKSRVVYIPTTGNYTVMLSVLEADEMVQQIQRWK